MKNNLKKKYIMFLVISMYNITKFTYNLYIL